MLRTSLRRGHQAAYTVQDGPPLAETRALLKAGPGVMLALPSVTLYSHLHTLITRGTPLKTAGFVAALKRAKQLLALQEYCEHLDPEIFRRAVYIQMLHEHFDPVRAWYAKSDLSVAELEKTIRAMKLHDGLDVDREALLSRPRQSFKDRPEADFRLFLTRIICGYATDPRVVFPRYALSSAVLGWLAHGMSQGMTVRELRAHLTRFGTR